MRRAILQKFILVLFGALILNGLIFYLVGSRVILNSSTRDMLYMLEVLDGSLDYESDLEKTMKKLDSVMDGNNSRLTVIDLDGTVVADTQAQMDEMDNHLDREEIQDALEKGSGYARRRSDTMRGCSMWPIAPKTRTSSCGRQFPTPDFSSICPCFSRPPL